MVVVYTSIITSGCDGGCFPVLQAALDIQAALRGHHARTARLRQLDGYSTDGSENYDDAVDLIKSSMRGHQARKQNLKRIQLVPLVTVCGCVCIYIYI